MFGTNEEKNISIEMKINFIVEINHVVFEFYLPLLILNFVRKKINDFVL